MANYGYSRRQRWPLPAVTFVPAAWIAAAVLLVAGGCGSGNLVEDPGEPGPPTTPTASTATPQSPSQPGETPSNEPLGGSQPAVPDGADPVRPGLDGPDSVPPPNALGTAQQKQVAVEIEN